MTADFDFNRSEMQDEVPENEACCEKNTGRMKPDGELHGAYINYRETADKRVVYRWIAEEMEKKKISAEGTAEIARIKGKHLILNISAAERKRDPYSCYTKLKYEELFRILEICGSTLHDFFDGVGVSLPELWPENADPSDEKYADCTDYLPKEISDLYHLCDALPEETRQKLLDLARKMSPVVWQSPIDDGFAIVREEDFAAAKQSNEGDRRSGKSQKYGGNPTKKAYWLFRRQELDAKKLREKTAFWRAEKTEEQTFEQFIKGREWQKPVRFEIMPRVAYALNVSLHELLGAPDTLFLYAKKPYTETIVAAYYFMSTPCKQLFHSIAATCFV